MGTLTNRGLSLLIAAAYVTLALISGAGFHTLKVIAFLALPLSCIWFSEELGSLGGNLFGHAITSTPPGFLVCAGGWLLLVMPVIAAFIMFHSTV